MGYGWGGYANGQIPLSAMIYCRGAWLEPTAAYWAEAMGQVFEHERGKPLMFLGYSEGFRPLGQPGDFAAGRTNTQFFYAERKKADSAAPAAASPGGSIHGWALAVDVDLTHLNADDIEWLHTRGRAFGWNWDTTGRPNDEPWHLDFNLTPTEAFDPNQYKEIDDMYNDDDRARDTATNEAMGRVEQHAWYLHKVIDELRFVVIGNNPGETITQKLEQLGDELEAAFPKSQIAPPKS
jgi:D-alanyl-D-alanine carboxypeptidase